ncbi:MAG: restriction endonuclease, SacI family [Planctomycetota bacterium JB042]
MGITIDRKAAEQVFLQALRLARSKAELPEEWIEQTDRVASSTNKTFTPALGTALLAKATDRHIDAFSLREDGGHKHYSARSVAKDVFVPCCKVANIDIRTTGAEPLNNQPFLRAARISVEMNVRRGTEADLRYLCRCLERADFLENEAALAAFAAFLRARIRATGELEEVGIEGRPLAMVRLVDATSAFVDAHSEGGKVGQAIVAAVFDLVHGDVRTRKINDPSRGWVGDVGAFVDGRVSLSAEVKQRPFSESEVLQFIDRLRADRVPRGLVAALAQAGNVLDIDALTDEARARFGIALDIVLGVRRLLMDTIRYISGDPHVAMALLPKFGLQRLKELEASEEVQRAWVEATTE